MSMDYYPISTFGLFVPDEKLLKVFDTEGNLVTSEEDREDYLDDFINESAVDLTNDDNYVQLPSVIRIDDEGHFREEIDYNTPENNRPVVLHFYGNRQAPWRKPAYKSKKHFVKKLRKAYADCLPEDYDFSGNIVFCEGVWYG